MLALSLSALSVRANTASVIPVSGTPSSSAFWAVQRPVPFCSAASRITSTSGWPVASSVLASTRAEISIRNDSSSESFQARSARRSRHLQSDAVAQQVIALGDQLHVGVLDAVVDHLHVVPGAVGADVGAARRPVDVGGDRLEDRLDRLVVGLAVAAGHDARPVQRSLLAAGDADAQEVDALLGELRVAALGVAEVGVAAVDQRCRPRRGAARSPRSRRRWPGRPGPCSSAPAGGRARATHSSTDSCPVDRALGAVLLHEASPCGWRCGCARPRGCRDGQRCELGWRPSWPGR